MILDPWLFCIYSSTALVHALSHIRSIITFKSQLESNIAQSKLNINILRIILNLDQHRTSLNMRFMDRDIIYKYYYLKHIQFNLALFGLLDPGGGNLFKLFSVVFIFH